MGVNLSKASHVIFFVVVLPIISLSVAWIASKIIPNPPFWIDTLSPIFTYGILYTIFDKYLWSLPLFRIFAVIDFPDLRGRWKGNQKSSYKQNNKNVEVVSYLEVKQSFSQINTFAYYEKSQSVSVVASFAQINSESYLFYTYDSDPNSMLEGTMKSHKGTVKLTCIPDEKKLVGVYFNSIGNHGEMSFNYEGQKLLHRFS